MKDFPGTINELFRKRVTETPSRPWLFFESDTYTFADADEIIDRFATGLAARNVKAGDRVALLLGNRPETIFVWLAANRIGAIAAILNPAFKAPEIEAFTKLAQPALFVTAENLGSLSANERSTPVVDVKPDDVAVLLSTSGTTGAPKAVAQTHRTYALTAEAFPWWLGLDENDRLLAALPLFHINAQAYATMGSLGANAGLALLPKFSASRFFADAKRLGATQFNAVGAMIHILLKGERRAEERDHPLRIAYAALALSEAEHRAFEERLGLRMFVGYGMSETTFGTVWPRSEPPRFGTMGVLRQHPRLGTINRARVVREDGTDAKDDEPGELWLSNPGTMQGYFHDPAATAAALADGFLHTGDVVRRDRDGFFTFVARKKDVIRRRGENISAAEVEAVLMQHASVREAAVVPAPSDLGEDEVVAHVAPNGGAAIDEAALIAFCKERLADFKVPSKVVVHDALPKTATERIAKHLLR